MYIDTHCHLHDPKFEDVNSVVEEYLKCGVSLAIDMGCCAETSKIGKELSEKFPSVYFASGCHPSDSDGFNEQELQTIASLADHSKCVAIGEIGLSGECRGVANVSQRVKEASRLGFTKAVIPVRNFERDKFDCNIELIPVKNIYDLLRVIRSQPEQKK